MIQLSIANLSLLLAGGFLGDDDDIDDSHIVSAGHQRFARRLRRPRSKTWKHSQANSRNAIGPLPSSTPATRLRSLNDFSCPGYKTPISGRSESECVFEHRFDLPKFTISIARKRARPRIPDNAEGQHFNGHRGSSRDHFRIRA